MNPDSLMVVHALRDSVAAVVADSVANAQSVKAMSKLLTQLFPWLSLQVNSWLSTFIGMLPVVALIFGWDFVRNKVHEAGTLLQPFVAGLAKFSFIINPILAALITVAQGGTAGEGFAAGGVWGFITAIMKAGGSEWLRSVTTATKSGQRKVGMGAVILGFGLIGAALTASDSRAEEGLPLMSWQRTHFSVGVGSRWQEELFPASDGTPRAFVSVRPGYGLSDTILLQGEVSREVIGAAPHPWEARLSLLWVWK